MKTLIFAATLLLSQIHLAYAGKCDVRLVTSMKLREYVIERMEELKLGYTINPSADTEFIVDSGRELTVEIDDFDKRDYTKLSGIFFQRATAQICNTYNNFCVHSITFSDTIRVGGDDIVENNQHRFSPEQMDAIYRKLMKKLIKRKARCREK